MIIAIRRTLNMQRYFKYTKRWKKKRHTHTSNVRLKTSKRTKKKIMISLTTNTHIAIRRATKLQHSNSSEKRATWINWSWCIDAPVCVCERVFGRRKTKKRKGKNLWKISNALLPMCRCWSIIYAIQYQKKGVKNRLHSKWLGIETTAITTTKKSCHFQSVETGSWKWLNWKVSAAKKKENHFQKQNVNHGDDGGYSGNKPWPRMTFESHWTKTKRVVHKDSSSLSSR